MISDLRAVLDVFESNSELIRIKEEVEPNYQITAFCRLVSDANGPALLFERIKGHTMPLAVNLFGTRRRIALALETTEQKMTERNLECLKKPLPPENGRGGSQRLGGHERGGYRSIQLAAFDLERGETADPS